MKKVVKPRVIKTAPKEGNIPRDDIKKAVSKVRVERTRCSGTKTEAGMVSWVLSYLRKMTLRWKPRFDRLNDGRMKKPLGKNGKEVWANTCEQCGKWFKLSDLAMDHIEPIGGMTKLEDAGRWLTKALVEIDGYQRLCKADHKTKTAEERASK